MITNEDLDNWFSHHSPSEEKIIAYQKIREAGKNLAQVVLNNTPPGADQTVAIQEIRKAVMLANNALACN